MFQKIQHLGLFLAAFALSAGPGYAMKELKVGAAAPDFTLTDSNGKTHKLSESKGKIVVLEWVNHGCPFVRKHYDAKNMQKLQKDYTAKGVVWYSINSSAKGKEGYVTPDQANKEIKENDAHPTAVLLDPEGTVGQLFAAQTTPHMFVIGKDGLLAYQGAIDDKSTTDTADVPKAKSYITAALDAMLAGKKVATASTKAYGCSVKYAKPTM